MKTDTFALVRTMQTTDDVPELLRLLADAVVTELQESRRTINELTTELRALNKNVTGF